MAPRLAKSLVKLRDQANAMAPKRSKTSDGWIGDTAHAARKSDHNPNATGVVQALDITHDPKNGMDSYTLAETLRLSQDKRLKYVISNGRIFSSTEKPWQWRTYSGSNKHSVHVHISVADDPKKYDNLKAWAALTFFVEEGDEPAVKPAPAPREEPVEPAPLPDIHVPVAPPPPIPDPVAPAAPPVPWYKRVGAWASGVATSLFGGGLYLGGVQINAETILALCVLLVVLGIGFLVYWFLIRERR